MMRRLLITGAAGEIGSVLRLPLREVAHSLRLNDIRALTQEHPCEEIFTADLHDPDVALAATREVDCIVHMAGVPRENAWEPILRNNIETVYTLFEAARLNGVRRIVFASSNHVTGFYRSDHPVDSTVPVRPDSRYGVSKVFGEALARLYADKHGMEMACLRIGSFRQRPQNVRELATWISPRDLTNLVRCCVSAAQFDFLVIYAVSANRRNLWADRDRDVVGWQPQDDAEQFAADLERLGPSTTDRFHGGQNCVRELTRDPTTIQP